MEARGAAYVILAAIFLLIFHKFSLAFGYKFFHQQDSDSSNTNLSPTVSRPHTLSFHHTPHSTSSVRLHSTKLAPAMSYGRDYTNGYSNGYSNGSESRDKTKYDPPPSRAASDSLTRSGYSNGYSDSSYSRGGSTAYSSYRDSNRDSTYESKYDSGRGGYGSSSNYGGGFDKFDKMADMGSGLKKQHFDLDKLPKFEKNFYREGPVVSRRSEREVNDFRNLKEIRVSGKTIPRPVETFEEAGFPCMFPPLHSPMNLTDPV